MSSSISDSAIPYTVEPRPDTGLFNAKLGVWLFLASEVMLFGALFSSYILLRLGAPHWPIGSTILNVPIGAFNTVVLISSSVTMVMAWASLKMNNVAKYRLFMGLTILCALLFLCVKAFEYGQKFGTDEAKGAEHAAAGVHATTSYFMAFWSNIWHNYIGAFKAPGIAVKIFPVLLTLGLVLFVIKGWKRALMAAGFVAVFSFIILTLFQMGVGSSRHYYPPRHSTFMAIYFTLTGLHGIHVIGGIIVNSFFWGPGVRMWQTEPERFTNRIEIAGLYWHFVDLVWIFLFPVLYLL
jgi:cytochrome c oxidase subunit III